MSAYTAVNSITTVPHYNIPPLQPSCPQLAVGVRCQRAGRHTTQCGRRSGVHTVFRVASESTPRLPLFFLSCRPVHVNLVGGLVCLHGVAGRQHQSISRLPCRLQHLIEPREFRETMQKFWANSRILGLLCIFQLYDVRCGMFKILGNMFRLI